MAPPQRNRDERHRLEQQEIPERHAEQGAHRPDKHERQREAGHDE
jgi:hypothetical protein